MGIILFKNQQKYLIWRFLEHSLSWAKQTESFLINWLANWHGQTPSFQLRPQLHNQNNIYLYLTPAKAFSLAGR